MALFPTLYCGCLIFTRVESFPSGSGISALRLLSSSFLIVYSFFWAALSVTSIVTSLWAFGLLHLDGVSGLAGWRSVHLRRQCRSIRCADNAPRWLFLIEGLITFLIGVAAFFLMPASAVQTKAWFRPNGWFTDRETAIVVNRVLRDDPSKGANYHVAEPHSPYSQVIR